MARIEKLLIQPFEIEVHYKKIKNIYLRIKPDGKITISAPLRTSKTYLIQFIESRSKWIIAKQQKILERKKLSIKLAKDEILLFGKPAKGNLSDAELQKLLHEKIDLYYQKYWPFFKRCNCKPIEIKYRVMKRTWAICRPTTGTITFSRRIVHQPVEFIEYIVLHEMCHLLIPNHGKDFYRLVASQMPHFRKYENARIVYDES